MIILSVKINSSIQFSALILDASNLCSRLCCEVPSAQHPSLYTKILVINQHIKSKWHPSYKEEMTTKGAKAMGSDVTDFMQFLCHKTKCYQEQCHCKRRRRGFYKSISQFLTGTMKSWSRHQKLQEVSLCKFILMSRS